MPQTYSFKIETGDFDRFVQTMRQVGASSEEVQRSFNSLINSSPQLASSMTRAEAAARGVVEQHRQIGVATSETTRNFGGMTETVRSAGFQLQDFVVQIQSGQSALTALSQQGSQFLGVFGTGGAIAGAILTIGTLALSFLDLGKAQEEAAKRTAELEKQLGAINTDRFALNMDRATEALKLYSAVVETATQKTARLRQEQYQQALGAVQLEAGRAGLARNDDAGKLRALDENLNSARDLLNNPAEARNLTGPMRQQLVDYVARQEGERSRLAERVARANQNADQLARAASELEARAPRFPGDPADLNGLPFGQDPPAGRSASGGGGGRSRGGGGGRAVRAMPDTTERDQNAIDSAARGLLESVDPQLRAVNQFNDALAKLRAAQELYRQSGGTRGITDEQAWETAAKLAERMSGSIDGATRKTAELADTGKDFATVFTSAFDGLISGSGKATDALKKLEQGVIRILERTFITKPLEQAATQAIGGFSLGSMFPGVFGKAEITGSAGSAKLAGLDGLGVINQAPAMDAAAKSGGLFSGLFGFADGGVMTPFGPMPLRRYAGGGVARGPQLAMFGEGDGPEAYVPLPDGRRIPVAMHGGGQPSIMIDARGAEIGVEARIEAALSRHLPGIASYTKQSLFGDVQRGGNAARTMRGR